MEKWLISGEESFMAWHTFDETTEHRLTACVQTRSGLTPVWQTAKELATHKDELLDLVLGLIRMSMETKYASPPSASAQEPDLRAQAEHEVEAFFQSYKLSYTTCYYIAIAVYDGCSYNDIRPFADALWAEFQKSFVEASPEEIRENTFLSVTEILKLANAETVEVEGEDNGSPWSRIVRFRNRYVAETCTRTVIEDYPLLSECLLRTSVAMLREEQAIACRRLLIQWAGWNYPAVVRAIKDAMEPHDSADEESQRSERVLQGYVRLLSVLLDVIESAAQTSRWRHKLLESAEELMQMETAELSTEPTVKSLKIIRILSGCAGGEDGQSGTLTQFYTMLRTWALDWYPKQSMSDTRWAVLLYCLFYLDGNEAFWHEFSRLITEDMDSDRKDQRIAGIACLTLLLYGDCLLTEKDHPVMGILRHFSAKRVHRAETAALLRRYSDKNTRFLCLETLLDEQIALLDEKEPENRQLWPFFRWMAFTGRSEDFSRWNDYLSLKVGRIHFASEVSAYITKKMEEAIASAK